MAQVLRQTSKGGTPPKNNPTAGQDFQQYWGRVWEEMPRKNRFLFGDDLENFYEALSTPDCFLDDHESSLTRKESHSILN
jgi:hypothetical protein